MWDWGDITSTSPLHLTHLVNLLYFIFVCLSTKVDNCKKRKPLCVLFRHTGCFQVPFFLNSTLILATHYPHGTPTVRRPQQLHAISGETKSFRKVQSSQSHVALRMVSRADFMTPTLEVILYSANHDWLITQHPGG